MASRIKFQQNLDDLKERLLIMAGMAEQAIQRSIEAYRTRDLSICELVFQSEPLINRLEREIDQMALDLLAMEQPMAIDLRFILAVIRINADLERVGDQAVNIAVRVREMGAFANTDLPVDIPKLASLSAANRENVHVVSELKGSSSDHPLYTANRDPLMPAGQLKLPIGSIVPSLRTRRRQYSGSRARTRCATESGMRKTCPSRRSSLPLAEIASELVPSVHGLLWAPMNQISSQFPAYGETETGVPIDRRRR